jgi:hypothetical protein
MSKIIWAVEWVRVRNFMNRHFRAAGLCSICRRGSQRLFGRRQLAAVK